MILRRSNMALWNVAGGVSSVEIDSPIGGYLLGVRCAFVSLGGSGAGLDAWGGAVNQVEVTVGEKTHGVMLGAYTPLVEHVNTGDTVLFSMALDGAWAGELLATIFCEFATRDEVERRRPDGLPAH